MNIGNMLLGRKSFTEQLPTRSPQQIAAMNQMLGMGMEGMQDPYAGFEPIAQQARTQFQQDTIPSLAERFTSMGGGAQRSSGFQSALGRAGAGLEQSLASLRAQYGLQNRGQMMQMANMGLMPQFENMYHPETRGLLGELAVPALRMGLGAATGGLAGMGLFGRGMMKGFRGQEGGSQYGGLLPLLMMMGGQ